MGFMTSRARLTILVSLLLLRRNVFVLASCGSQFDVSAAPEGVCVEDGKGGRSDGCPSETCLSEDRFEALRERIGLSEARGRDDYTVVLDMRNWIAHEIMTSIFRILLQEMVGYKKVQVNWVLSSEGLFPRAADPDCQAINLEAWNIKTNQHRFDVYTQYVVQEQHVSVDPLGVVGREGIYVPSFLPFITKHYKALQEDSTFRRNCPATGELAFSVMDYFPDVNDTDISQFFPDGEPYACPDGLAAPGWNISSCEAGRWFPTYCKEAGAECKELFMANPLWSTGLFEATVQNLNLNLVPTYLGYKGMVEYIGRMHAQRRGYIHYGWEPESLISRYPAEVLILPEHSEECKQSFNPEPLLSGYNCSTPSSHLLKVINRDLQASEPDLNFLWEKFHFTTEMQMELLSWEWLGGGSLSVEETACRWLRESVDIWEGWLRIHVPESPLAPPSPIEGESNSSDEGSQWQIVLIIVVVLLMSVWICACLIHHHLVKTRRSLRGLLTGGRDHILPIIGQKAYILITDIQDSTTLWERNPTDMYKAVSVHHSLVRRLLVEFGGYEMDCEGDGFTLAFHHVQDMVGFAMAFQEQLAEQIWPSQLLEDIHSVSMQRQEDLETENPIMVQEFTANIRAFVDQERHCSWMDEEHSWTGLRVRIGMHCGFPERHSVVSGRSILRGQCCETAKSIADCIVSGGQMVCSEAVLSELSDKLLEKAVIVHQGRHRLHHHGSGGHHHGGGHRGGDHHNGHNHLPDELTTEHEDDIDLVSLQPVSLAARHLSFLPLKSARQLTPTAFQCPRNSDKCAILFCRVFEMKALQRELAVAESILRGSPTHTQRGFRRTNSFKPGTVLPSTSLETDILVLFEQVVRNTTSSDRYPGYVVEAKPGFFLLAFHTPGQAANWAANLQEALMAVEWPQSLLETPLGQETSISLRSQEGPRLVYRGLRVQCGLAYGEIEAVSLHKRTGRAAYFGPSVNTAARAVALADGGQVLVAINKSEEEISRFQDEVAGCCTEECAVVCLDLGLMQLKGLQEERRIVQVHLQALECRAFPPIKTLTNRTGSMKWSQDPEMIWQGGGSAKNNNGWTDPVTKAKQSIRNLPLRSVSIERDSFQTEPLGPQSPSLIQSISSWVPSGNDLLMPSKLSKNIRPTIRPPTRPKSTPLILPTEECEVLVEEEVTPL